MYNVEEFITNLEGNQKKIAEYLQHILTEEFGLEAKIRFKIPFYFRKTWICYLNPLKNDGIELAFIRGNELSNEFGSFDFKGRKQVMGVTLYSINDLSKNILYNTLIEALTLDENVKYNVVKK
jgi:hypothetical protein